MTKSSKQIQKEIAILLIDHLEAGRISLNRLKEISKKLLEIIPDTAYDQDEIPASIIIELEQIPEIRTIIKQND